MKKIIIFSLLLILFISCGDSKKEVIQTPSKEVNQTEVKIDSIQLEKTFLLRYFKGSVRVFLYRLRLFEQYA